MLFIEANKETFMVGRTWDKKEYRVLKIVIHSIVGSLQSAIGTFQAGVKKVSSHYIVGWDGKVVQMVRETDTAYHAGNWGTNLTSIGIEHDDQNKPYEVRPDVLYEASAILCADICKRYNLPINRETIVSHNEVSDNPTACPASLDIDRIVRRAKEISEGKVEETTIENIPAAIKSYTRNIIVSADLGANVRNTPSTSGNIVKVFQKDVSFAVEGFIDGETISGNSTWYKLRNEDSYLWAGATNIPNPVSFAEEKKVDSLTPVEALTTDELKLQNTALQTKLKEAVKLATTLKDEYKVMEESYNEQKKTLGLYKAKEDNEELVKNANKILSEQIDAYKLKITELKAEIRTAYIDAFKSWELISIPKGIGSLAKIPVYLYKLFKVVAAAKRTDVVIGWKLDSRLYTVEQYKELYGNGEV